VNRGRREGDKGKNGIKEGKNKGKRTVCSVKDMKEGRGSGTMIRWKNKKFWEELIAYFPLIRHGPHTKRGVQQFFYCCMCCSGNVFTEMIGKTHRQTER
jgi:hypothetical protein